MFDDLFDGSLFAADAVPVPVHEGCEEGQKGDPIHLYFVKGVQSG